MTYTTGDDTVSKSEGFTERFNPSKGKTPEEERMPQVLDDLKKAAAGSSVMYFAWANLPEEFLRAIAAKDNTFAAPLRGDYSHM